MPFCYASRQVSFIRIVGLTVSFFLLNLTGFAQAPATREEIVFTVVEHQPEFPGGPAALTKYMQQHVNYPPEAKKANVKGKVQVSFIVEKDGSLTDVQLLKKLGYGCDEEALRVVNTMSEYVSSGSRVRSRVSTSGYVSGCRYCLEWITQ